MAIEFLTQGIELLVDDVQAVGKRWSRVLSAVLRDELVRLSELPAIRPGDEGDDDGANPKK